ncbi:MAG TPA: outer membrane lipid asymmetry maintenance protein MlaD [Gammaproteobacteria bacterium]|nr:outer membrane lipid asymmetry maintenance protein MlaD [Gammaproteobacteria bacterium]
MSVKRKKPNVELMVGLFVIVSILAGSYLSVVLGGANLFSKLGYDLTARFSTSTGLKTGAALEIAGVKVGTVKSISLDKEEYESIVVLNISSDIKLTDDSIASIRTAGIIGDRFVKLTPGGSEIMLEDGDEISETESSIVIEELISKYIFESKSKD